MEHLRIHTTTKTFDVKWVDRGEITITFRLPNDYIEMSEQEINPTSLWDFIISRQSYFSNFRSYVSIVTDWKTVNFDPAHLIAIEEGNIE